jgi:CheY-like chemotaxis protein
MTDTTAPSDLPLVLIVDDDAELRAYIREGLAHLPIQTDEARDGRDALDRLASHMGKVALVITDLFMERMDGRALKAALQRDQRWAHVPVLLITGESTRARDGPVLRKPFNARRLAASVQNLIDL